MKTSQKLNLAAYYIAQGFCKGVAARSESGASVQPSSKQAVKFCSAGAIERVCVDAAGFGKYRMEPLFDLFRSAIGMTSIASWNDSVDRNQAEVFWAFLEARDASRLAEQGFG